MCFAPQPRAVFPYLNFQKCSEHDVFWHFLLQNVLRTTTACNFSFLICPDVSAPAALASLLFDPPEQQNAGKKHSVSRLSYLFAHQNLLSSDFLHLWSSPLWLSTRPSFFLALLFICPYCQKFHFRTSFDNAYTFIYIYISYVCASMHVYLYIVCSSKVLQN